MGDADPVPASLFVSHPEQANTLSLLYDVSREITSILDREDYSAGVAHACQKTGQLPRLYRDALQ
jgi:hypothetical protein